MAVGRTEKEQKEVKVYQGLGVWALTQPTTFSTSASPAPQFFSLRGVVLIFSAIEHHLIYMQWVASRSKWRSYPYMCFLVIGM